MPSIHDVEKRRKEEPKVEISLERYTTLIKKEVIFDELMKEKEAHIYLLNKGVNDAKSSGFNGALNK